MLAAVCAWHAEHQASLREITRRLTRGERLVVATAALVETYSVLTRLPSPHRLSAADALALVEANFMTHVKLVALPARSYASLLRNAPRLGITGGRTYDAVIAQCALQAGAQTLLTLNPAHFREWGNERLKIVVPSEAIASS